MELANCSSGLMSETTDAQIDKDIEVLDAKVLVTKSVPTGVDQRRATPSSASLLNTILDLLASMSNESLLIAFAVGTIAFYVVFGRLGLVIVSLSVGYVLGQGTHSESSKRFLGLDGKGELSPVASSVLDWPERKPISAPELDGDTDYVTFRPLTAAALRSLTDSIIKDYVKYWYGPILPNEQTFPHECRRILCGFIVSASCHLSRKRMADVFLQFVMNSSSVVIVFMNELSLAFQNAGASFTSLDQAVNNYLAHFPTSNLANMLDHRQQREKLKTVADDFLSSFLDPKEYGSSAVRSFLREIFAGIIMESTISSLSRPESINSWIIFFLRDGESEIMSAIDAGVEGARKQTANVSRIPSGSEALARDQTASTKLECQMSVREQNEVVGADKSTQAAMREAKRLSALLSTQTSNEESPEPDRTAISSSINVPDDAGASSEIQTTSGQNDTSCDEEMVSPVPDTVISSSTSQRVSDESNTRQNVALSLLGAWVSVDDGSDTGDKALLKSRPTSDYFLQIEPASSRFPGWIIFRKYADFESLHETLDTIARLNNLQDFREKHSVLPVWKGQTRKMLARGLEQYLQDGLRHELLAESPRMKRFLEKDVAQAGAGAGSPAKIGFPFRRSAAFETMGKGVLDALTNAPKGMAGSSRAVLDGVTGVFGGVATGPKKSSSSIPTLKENKTSPNGTLQDLKDDPINRSISLEHGVQRSPSLEAAPSELKDDTFADKSIATFNTLLDVTTIDNRTGFVIDSQSEDGSARQSLDDRNRQMPIETVPGEPPNAFAEVLQSDASRRHVDSPITDEETRIAVELIFAVINELYTLSSAWNIRRALLNTAKSFILRPGSPTLETIRSLLQESMIDAHTSDEAISAYLTKLRENALPDEEELKFWPPEPDDAEKERLRETARKLFIQRGIPQALMSVMGAPASREALEKIFDCLQVESIARGLVYALILQAAKAVIM